MAMHNGHGVNGVWHTPQAEQQVYAQSSLQNIRATGTPTLSGHQNQILSGSPNQGSQGSARDHNNSPYGQSPGVSNPQISEQAINGTTYFVPESAKQQTMVVYPPFNQYPGFPIDTSVAFMERTVNGKPNARESFFVGEQYRQYILNKQIEAQTTLAPDQASDGQLQPFPDVTPSNSSSKESYHALYPLEQLLEQKSQTLNAQTSTFRGTKVEDGMLYCLKRIHGCRTHSQDGYKNLQKWTHLRHGNIISLHTAFTIKAFGDQSIMFVYDFHPGAETLMQRHFVQNNYWKTKRQNVLITEPLIWTYVVQLTSALRTIHAKDLAYRQMFPTNIVVTGKSRIRLNYPSITDMLTGDINETIRYQQEDLIHLGRLVLALCCNSTQPFQADHGMITQCLEVVRKGYSQDLSKLIAYLLKTNTNGGLKSVDALMPMIGARFYTQLDSALLWGDMVEGEMEREIENGRLVRLMCKLGAVNARPNLSGAGPGNDQSWAESGDRFLVRMFRNYLFRQVNESGQPWLEISHIIAALNKLDAGSEEKVMLQSQDEQNVILVTYNDLKKALAKCFNELYAQSKAERSLQRT